MSKDFIWIILFLFQYNHSSEDCNPFSKSCLRRFGGLGRVSIWTEFLYKPSDNLDTVSLILREEHDKSWSLPNTIPTWLISWIPTTEVLTKQALVAVAKTQTNQSDSTHKSLQSQKFLALNSVQAKSTIITIHNLIHNILVCQQPTGINIVQKPLPFSKAKPFLCCSTVI